MPTPVPGACPDAFTPGTSGNADAARLAAEGGSPPLVGAAGDPRVVTRGESPQGMPNAFADWLSFTVPEAAQESPWQWGETLSILLEVPDLEIGPQDKGIAGFTYSVPLVIPRAGEPVIVGKIAWGGESQRERAYISLSGALCSRVGDWSILVNALDLTGARITRVDLAHDDYQGKRSVNDAVAMYDAGQFKAGGRNPICSLQGDWKEVSGHGRTFYVGKRGHGKLLRVYEKGKQLGDASSPWVRWEVEFHNRDRIIPYSVLTDPARYLAGAFPALGFISEERTPIRTQRKALVASLDHLVECLSKSYGKTINAMVMQGLDPSDIIALTQRGGVPERLKRPLAGLVKGAKLYGVEHGEP